MAGPQCCESPPPRDQPPVGVGRLESFEDLTAYVTGPFDATAAVILISDVFAQLHAIARAEMYAKCEGIQPALSYDTNFIRSFEEIRGSKFRKLADKVAEAGYLVVVPDYFNGDPYVPDQSNIQEMLKNHAPEKGFEDSVKIIEILKSRGITSTGAAGFCWGAKVVVELAKGEDLKAGVLLHPSRVTVDDIKAVKVPLAILGAEIDRTSPPELVKQFEVILAEKSEVDSFVYIYPGVAHGWTVRYDENDETAVTNAELAHKKMLEWFKKYVN